MTVRDWLTIALLVAGAFFIFAGTVGLLRFPDVYTRLHALTKADNMGLGLIVAGLMVQADSITLAVKLFVIWVLALVAAGTNGYLIANQAQRGDDAVGEMTDA